MKLVYSRDFQGWTRVCQRCQTTKLVYPRDIQGWSRVCQGYRTTKLVYPRDIQGWYRVCQRYSKKKKTKFSFWACCTSSGLIPGISGCIQERHFHMGKARSLRCAIIMGQAARAGWLWQGGQTLTLWADVNSDWCWRGVWDSKPPSPKEGSCRGAHTAVPERSWPDCWNRRDETFSPGETFQHEESSYCWTHDIWREVWAATFSGQFWAAKGDMLEAGPQM